MSLSRGAVPVTPSSAYVSHRNEFVRHSVLAKKEYKKNKQRYNEFSRRVEEERASVQKTMDDHDVKCVSVRVPRLDESSRPTGEHDVVYIKKCERVVNPTFTSKVLSSVLEGDGSGDADADVQRVSDLLQMSIKILADHDDRIRKYSEEAAKQERRAAKRERGEETKAEQEEKNMNRVTQRKQAKEFRDREEARIHRLEQSIARNMATSLRSGPSSAADTGRAPATPGSAPSSAASSGSASATPLGVLERRIQQQIKTAASKQQDQQQRQQQERQPQPEHVQQTQHRRLHSQSHALSNKGTNRSVRIQRVADA